ncbi:hypothetical protein NJ76_31910, partial [Rhodococcus sp. IITR03]
PPRTIVRGGTRRYGPDDALPTGRWFREFGCGPATNRSIVGIGRTVRAIMIARRSIMIGTLDPRPSRRCSGGSLARG